MTRGLIVLAGLLIGLGLAVLSAGQLRHLRAALPGTVPGWSVPVEGTSTLWRGQARALRLSGWPVAADLGWRFGRAGAEGLIWDVTLAAPGLRGRADLGLPWSLDLVGLRTGHAEIRLEEWPGLIGGWPLRGLVSVEDLTADLALPGGRPLALSARITLAGGQLADADLGSGEAMLVSEPGGGWRMPVSVAGPAVRVSGSLEGRFGTHDARLDLRIVDAGAMPDAWRRALDQAARAEAGGWIITRDIDLSAGWPLF